MPVHRNLLAHEVVVVVAAALRRPVKSIGIVNGRHSPPPV